MLKIMQKSLPILGKRIHKTNSLMRDLECRDRGCPGYKGRAKGLRGLLNQALKRRDAIEPHIRHMKRDQGVNYLKGKLVHTAVLACRSEHNLRLILNYLRKFSAFLGFDYLL